jgi:sulfate transport system permease protein
MATSARATPFALLRSEELAADAHPVAASPRNQWTRGRIALLAIVQGYVALVLLLPLAALVEQGAGAGASNLLRALAQPESLAALWKTVVLVVVSVGINGVFGVAGAIAVVRHRFWSRRLLDALTDLPLAVSPVMTGLAFLLLVGRDGWLAPVLDRLGIQVAFAFPGLLVATLFVTLPFTLREVAYVLEELGTTEEEVAATLGASASQTFWRVTFPNLRHGLVFGITLTTARALGEFGAVLVLGGAISGKTQTATTFIYTAMEERQTSGAYGMALVLALVSVVLLLMLERAKRRKGDL